MILDGSGGYYLAREILRSSLSVSSERSDGTRISTGWIRSTLDSSSDRDVLSVKQSTIKSPMVGWTTCGLAGDLKHNKSLFMSKRHMMVQVPHLSMPLFSGWNNAPTLSLYVFRKCMYNVPRERQAMYCTVWEIWKTSWALSVPLHRRSAPWSACPGSHRHTWGSCWGRPAPHPQLPPGPPASGEGSHLGQASQVRDQIRLVWIYTDTWTNLHSIQYFNYNLG